MFLWYFRGVVATFSGSFRGVFLVFLWCFRGVFMAFSWGFRAVFLAQGGGDESAGSAGFTVGEMSSLKEQSLS